MPNLNIQLAQFWFTKGLKDHDQEQLNEALASYQKALSFNPKHRESLYNLAMIQQEQKMFEKAIATYRRVLELDPNLAAAHKNLGDIFFVSYQFDKAADSYRKALSLKPDYIESLYNLGLTENKRQKPEIALNFFEKALKYNPNYTPAIVAIANLLQNTERINEALTLYQQALKITPQDTDIYLKISETYEKIGFIEDAFKWAHAALKIEPANSGAHNILGLLNLQKGLPETAIKYFQMALSQSPEQSHFHSNLLYAMLMHPKTDPATYLKEANLWWKNHGAPAAAVSNHSHRRSLKKSRRLRIGFISPDLKRHSVSFFLIPLLENLKSSEFEIFCYANLLKTDDYSNKIRDLSHHWRAIFGIEDNLVANMIEADKIDILIELSGHMAGNRLPLMAKKPAPIQFSWLGYPASSGLRNGTFRLTDRLVEPQACKDHYSEPLVFLPNYFICYAPPFEAIALTRTTAPPNSTGITFGSFNNPAKLNSTVISIWSKILLKTPNSKLLLKAKVFSDKNIIQDFKNKFAKNGITSNQLDFRAGNRNPADHFKTYMEMDIALDPFPYNGTTTTCEALWMEVPVITLLGTTHAARVSATILQAIDCSEFIGNDLNDYINKAVKLAQTLTSKQTKQLNLRYKIQNSPLMNAQSFAKEFAEVLRGNWRIWRQERLTLMSRLAKQEASTYNLPKNLPEMLAENDSALSLLEKTLAIDTFQQSLYCLGCNLNSENKPQLARASWREALSINPNNIKVRLELARSLQIFGRVDEAACHFKLILDIDPKNVDATLSLNNIFSSQQDHINAKKILEQYLRHNPNNSEIYFQLGTVLHHLQRPKQSHKALKRCLELNPKDARAWNNLGYLLQDSGSTEEVISAFSQALHLDPDQPETATNLLWYLVQECAWKETSIWMKKLNYFDSLQNRREQVSTTPMFLHLAQIDDSKTNLVHARKVADKLSKNNSIAPKHHHIYQENNIVMKIGYLSGDFRNHPVAHNMVNLFKLHDRNKFHVTVYSCGENDGSYYRKQIENDCDQFIDIKNISDKQAAQMIKNDNLEILIELMGHTRNNRLSLCAYRPAPVQISYLGYPGTTGADFIDFIIADKTVIPDGDEKYYSEKILYLKNCFMVADQAHIARTPSRVLCGLPEKNFIFCSFNNAFKIEPVMFSVWMDILKQVPGSLLWLKSGSDRMECNLRNEAQIRGVDPARLIFATKTEKKEEHLARLQLADLALDTRIYNGHTTTLDTLWAGVPLVTLKGHHFASRVSASNLKAIGLPEMITNSLTDYKNLAIKLALQPQNLQKLRHKLTSNRMTYPLFDTKATVLELEKAYTSAWNNICK